LFCDNETNFPRVFGSAGGSAHPKDAFHDYVVHGDRERVSKERRGTKAAAHYECELAPGATVELRLRLSLEAHAVPFLDYDALFATRVQECDDFYAELQAEMADEDARRIQRQAFAGMIWSKQTFHYDVREWLAGDETQPKPPEARKHGRNAEWDHLTNEDVISMPDKWEYPWYAAWDLAFHTNVLGMVDLDFAKHQLELMFDALYIHPSGQVPAYEWNFGDVNPPVHAWATLNLYNLEKERTGQGDVEFLKRVFDKLMFNFSWWVNRKDPDGRNVFEGGFLGLDNIGVFDRSAQLPTGGHLEQADGTAWMAFFSQNMLEISLELAQFDPAYQRLATKFCEHFLWIAGAMDRIGNNADELWDEEDGFFYDVLMFPDGNACRLKVRSLVGLLPLCAVTVFYPQTLLAFPDFLNNIRRFLERNAHLTINIAPPSSKGQGGRHILAILNEGKLRRVLGHMLDEKEFLSDHGIRSVSRHHLEHPYIFRTGGQEYRVDYQPAESSTGLFGGNSNWRGPIWFPVNMLLVRGLLYYYLFYGDNFKVECPTGSGKLMNLCEVAQELNRRLCSIFLRDKDGRRPVYGAAEKFQRDPHWRNYVLFYEYFHGDNGAGVGAGHQTGWSGLVARMLQLSVGIDAEKLLNAQRKPVLVPDQSLPKAMASD